jgi:hypothetical protein
MRNLLAERKIDWKKWLGWVVALGFLVAVALYGYGIKEQLWFTVANPEVVGMCREGYEAEHSEATKRFELRQHSEIISPLSESGKE